MGMLVASWAPTRDFQEVTAFLIQRDRILPSVIDFEKTTPILRNRITDKNRHVPIRSITSKRQATTKDTDQISGTSSESSSSDEPLGLVGVVAPLHRIGPYTCLRLQFPDWKSDNKDKDDETTYDFMIDTGANVNSIDAGLVEKYQLAEFAMPLTPAPGTDSKGDNSVLSHSSLIGATTSASSSGKDTPHRAGTLHMLGNCQLSGLPPPPITFLRNLVAASLPFASPVGAGILGLPFCWTFPAGLEFDWYGTDGDPPTIIFYYGNEPPTEAAEMEKMVRVPLQTLMGGLMTLEISVNNIKMQALLDTGSPLTVLNDQACELLGIDKDHQKADADMGVKIFGIDGSPAELLRLKEEVSVQVLSDDPDTTVSLGNGHVWTGPLAGVDLIRRLGGKMTEEKPAAVLGLDFLQNAYRMLLRAPSNEVWFEELPEGFERKHT